ncbi:MAG TPA: hypothetical protein PK406_00760 [Verrucomicrobiota bacterium]|nr:hypothetical protein [Verrucomicrobiota bacterium]
MNLQEALIELAKARKALDGAQARLDMAMLAMKMTPQYATVEVAQAGQRNAEELVTQAGALVRQLAIDAFVGTGNKTPSPGVSIKLYKVAHYDPEAAKAWCRENAAGYLALDTKRFEKAAPVLKDIGAPVQIIEDPRAVIASDLGGLLKEGA